MDVHIKCDVLLVIQVDIATECGKTSNVVFCMRVPVCVCA